MTVTIATASKHNKLCVIIINDNNNYYYWLKSTSPPPVDMYMYMYSLKARNKNMHRHRQVWALNRKLTCCIDDDFSKYVPLLSSQYVSHVGPLH